MWSATPCADSALPGLECDDPVWAPDGRRLAFECYDGEGGPGRIYGVDVEGPGDLEVLYEDSVANRRFDIYTWTPDGKDLVLGSYLLGEMAPAQVLRLGSEEPMRPLFDRETAMTSDVRFSPDGRWMAYLSDETEEFELHVAPYPVTGPGWLIPTGKIEGPVVWSADGKELFYIDAGKRLMAVDIETRPGFSASAPQPLFDLDDVSALRMLDIAPDGERFLLIQRGEREGDTLAYRVVFDWFQELERRVR